MAEELSIRLSCAAHVRVARADAGTAGLDPDFLLEGSIQKRSGTLVSVGTNYSSLFNIDTTGWSGGLTTGGFQVITLGNTTDLYLQAIGSAAVPEPGQIAASLLLLAGIGGYVWVRSRKGAKKKNAVA